MIPQNGGGGGGGSHGHPGITSSYAPVGQGGGTLIQTRGILEEGCYCFANLWST